MFSIFAFFTSPFGLPQQNKDKKQWYQRKREERRSSPPVDGTVDDLGVHVNREKADGKDPRRVPQDTDREEGEGQEASSPGGSKKEIRRQQAGDEEDQAGAYAAALWGYVNSQSREKEQGPIA